MSSNKDKNKSIWSEIWLKSDWKDFSFKNTKVQALKNAQINKFQVSRGEIFF